jgi:hypothetical protein
VIAGEQHHFAEHLGGTRDVVHDRQEMHAALRHDPDLAPHVTSRVAPTWIVDATSDGAGPGAGVVPTASDLERATVELRTLPLLSHEEMVLAELIANSGLPRIRPLQDLRHTHASLLLTVGEPPKVVQERLGHHSPAFTQTTYRHLLPGMGEAAARRFEALVLDADDDEEAS